LFIRNVFKISTKFKIFFLFAQGLKLQSYEVIFKYLGMIVGENSEEKNFGEV